MWALARLQNALPDDSYRRAALRAARFVATERNDRDFVPVGPLNDHWAAHAFAEMAAWPIGDAEADYARSLAGRFAALIRWEAQKDSGAPYSWTHGPPRRAAALGTWVEGQAALAHLARTDHRLADLRDRHPRRARSAARACSSRATRWQRPRVAARGSTRGRAAWTTSNTRSLVCSASPTCSNRRRDEGRVRLAVFVFVLLDPTAAAIGAATLAEGRTRRDRTVIVVTGGVVAFAVLTLVAGRGRPDPRLAAYLPRRGRAGGRARGARPGPRSAVAGTGRPGGGEPGGAAAPARRLALRRAAPRGARGGGGASSHGPPSSGGARRSGARPSRPSSPPGSWPRGPTRRMAAPPAPSVRSPPSRWRSSRSTSSTTASSGADPCRGLIRPRGAAGATMWRCGSVGRCAPRVPVRRARPRRRAGRRARCRRVAADQRAQPLSCRSSPRHRVSTSR